MVILLDLCFSEHFTFKACNGNKNKVFFNLLCEEHSSFVKEQQYSYKDNAADSIMLAKWLLMFHVVRAWFFLLH